MTTFSANQIADVAWAAGFRGDRLVTAVAVALGESSGRVEVVNSIGCVGLWQINQPVHVRAHPNWTRGWLQGAKNNARAAYALSSGGVSWSPWQVYTEGTYRKHLPAARRAAAQAGPAGSGGGGSGPGKAVDDQGRPKPKADRKAGEKKQVPPPPPPKSEDDPDPRVRLGRLLVKGTKLRGEVSEAATAAVLSWSTDEVTQLALTFADPGFALFRAAEFEKGTRLIYREPGMDELRLRVASVALDGGPAGTGGFTVNARSEGAWALKRRRGPKVMRKASPSDFVKAECKAVGLKAVCQPSPSRTQVARDVKKEGDAEQGASRPSSWTTFLRLASELGFYVFEFGGTVYFGKPTWLMGRTQTPVQVALPLPGAPAVWAAQTMPTLNVSEDADVAVEVSGILLPPQRFKECRPGKALQLRGLPPFNDKYLITSMSVPLLGAAMIELTAATPKNPDPQPPQKPSSGGGSGSSYDDEDASTSAGGGGGSDGALSAASGGPLRQSGTRSAYDFVRMALTASSAAYVYGAEASSSDSSPSALDCSELIEWALRRVGVTFVDGSANQIARCRRITVEQALRTRGALLYKSGHIGISMGDGRSVEARNPSAGVGVFRARDIVWTAGGLVPGLRYG